MVVVSAAGVGPFGRASAKKATCAGPSMTVAAVPDAADVLTDIVKSAGCPQIKITRAQATDVLPSVVTSTDQPDVWIPDSSLWLQRAVPAQVRPATLKASMATSPVVLVSGDGVPRRSFGQALTEQDFAIGDPQHSESALATMAASQHRLRTVKAMSAHAQQVILGRSNAIESDAGRLADLRNTGLGSTATSEQQWVTYAPDLTATAPSDGTAVLDFPVLLTASQERRTKIATTIAEFSDILDSRSAQRKLTAAGFRTDLGGNPKPNVGKFSALSSADVAATAYQWDADVEPTRAIVVGDVSKSMETPVGAGTRLLDMQHAIKDEVGRLPANASIALWAFSDKQNGKLGEDYVEEVPMRRLDFLLYPDHQRDLINQGIDGLGKLTGGGSSIYESTVAAYKEALDSYDPMASNSVVLLTDGSDDEDETSLTKAIKALQSLKDSRRPLPILAIGMGPDADMSALSRLAEATGGAAYEASDSTQTSSVLHHAMDDRKAKMQ
ncbi:MAG: substrate-binding domain-containing protein [Nocardioides sp.]|nr:substrate-binding domain-containing protein [Nocardioides sp.]